MPEKMRLGMNSAGKAPVGTVRAECAWLGVNPSQRGKLIADARPPDSCRWAGKSAAWQASHNGYQYGSLMGGRGGNKVLGSHQSGTPPGPIFAARSTSATAVSMPPR